MYQNHFLPSNHQFLVVETASLSIGGLVVKLAVAIPVSASPGFDSRPMQSYFLPFFASPLTTWEHPPMQFLFCPF
jgi:hypothetical protein